MLIIPNKVVNRANTSDTFRPYDPNEALGDVQPNTPTPRPQASQSKKKNKCGIFGAILLAVVAIAVTVVTSGAILAATGAVQGGIGAGITATLTGAGASTGALIGAGVVGGAVGSIVSQGVGVATGLQDKFSWKGVALAAIAGGVGPAVGGSKLINGINSGVVKAGVGAIASNAITQGIAVATGLQHQFNWTAVAAAGVGGVVGYEAGKLFGAKPFLEQNPTGPGFIAGDTSAGNYLAHLGQSGAALVANAATRSLIDGSDFGDNITAALPDVIAQTLGDLLFYGVKGNGSARTSNAPAGSPGIGSSDASGGWLVMPDGTMVPLGQATANGPGAARATGANGDRVPVKLGEDKLPPITLGSGNIGYTRIGAAPDKLQQEKGVGTSGFLQFYTLDGSTPDIKSSYREYADGYVERDISVDGQSFVYINGDVKLGDTNVVVRFGDYAPPAGYYAAPAVAAPERAESGNLIQQGLDWLGTKIETGSEWCSSASTASSTGIRR